MSSPEEIVQLLRENAKYGPEEIARQLDSDPADVEAAIDELEAAGTIRGYSAVLDHQQRDNGPVRAAVEVNVTLDRESSYDDIADRIAKFRRVESLHLVSGEFDLLLYVEGDSMQEVSDFISNKVAPVKGVTQTVSHFVMTTYKEQGIEFDDDDGDDRLSISP
jgi:DNA-binding Lrp family transcriptional regulator